MNILIFSNLGVQFTKMHYFLKVKSVSMVHSIKMVLYQMSYDHKSCTSCLGTLLLYARPLLDPILCKMGQNLYQTDFKETKLN